MTDRVGEIRPSLAPGTSDTANSIRVDRVSAEVMMMLLADARLPTGAHTQSAGLEAALRGGMAPVDVPRYIRARLRTVTAVEAAAAVIARVRTVDASLGLTMNGIPTPGGDRIPAPRDDRTPAQSRDRTPAQSRDRTPAQSRDRTPAQSRDRTPAQSRDRTPALTSPDNPDLPAALAAVDAAWRARTISPALRETSVLLGRGYARLVRRLWPGSRGAEALSGIGKPGRAVVLGVAAALAGLSAAQLIRLIGYDDVQTVAAATLKLEPLDPVVTTGWVMSAAPEIERLVGELAAIDDIEQMPAFGAPLIEQWAQVHATTSQRLFRA
ncbi:urease accessory protein UreF [Nakamurella sp. GG22]